MNRLHTVIARHVVVVLISLFFALHAKPAESIDNSKSLTAPITPTTAVVGSKTFTESYILAEIMARKLEQIPGISVVRKFGLGGTGIAFEALLKGEVDFYIEYTGTIRDAILKSKSKNEDLVSQLKARGLVISQSLGFNNTYGIAVRKSTANRLQLKNISDLARPNLGLKFAFSHEFSERADGLKGLLSHYQLKLPSADVRYVSQALVYNAIEAKEIDVAEVYSTDAKIKSLDLVLLNDDLRYFPSYEAVILAKDSFKLKNPIHWSALTSLEGKISNETMQALNAKADIDRQSFSQIANNFVGGRDSLGNEDPTTQTSSQTLSDFWRLAKEHLFLISVSIGLSVVLGLPIGILASRYRLFGQSALATISFLQTIPSLALLCFLVPWMGIGATPALVALVLYGLLPVISGTYRGLTEIDSKTIEYAKTMQLTEFQRLGLIELPLASPAILNGVQTSSIFSVGTATVAALVGAGGFGTPIVTGLALNDNNMILQGALPSAILAILLHYIFEGLRLLIIPAGLRKSFR